MKIKKKNLNCKLTHGIKVYVIILYCLKCILILEGEILDFNLMIITLNLIEICTV